jgi:hypothetical protein
MSVYIWHGDQINVHFVPTGLKFSFWERYYLYFVPNGTFILANKCPVRDEMWVNQQNNVFSSAVRDEMF